MVTDKNITTVVSCLSGWCEPADSMCCAGAGFDLGWLLFLKWCCYIYIYYVALLVLLINIYFSPQVSCLSTINSNNMQTTTKFHVSWIYFNLGRQKSHFKNRASGAIFNISSSFEFAVHKRKGNNSEFTYQI